MQPACLLFLVPGLIQLSPCQHRPAYATPAGIGGSFSSDMPAMSDSSCAKRPDGKAFRSHNMPLRQGARCIGQGRDIDLHQGLQWILRWTA